MGARIEDRPSKPSNQYNQQVSTNKCERGLLSGFVVWCLKKVLGSIIISTLRYSSAEHLLSAGIAISILLGLVFDLKLVYISQAYMTTIPGICTALGGLGGAGAAGLGGALVGVIWGWLVGKIADVSVSTTTSESLNRTMGALGAFFVAAVMGWGAGKVASWGYDNLASKNKFIYKAIGYTAITISICSLAIFLFEIAEWWNYSFSLPRSDRLYSVQSMIFDIIFLILILIILFAALFATRIIVQLSGYEGLSDFVYSINVQWQACQWNAKALINTLENHNCTAARSCAARALGDLTTTLAVQSLMNASEKDISSKVRKVSQESLTKVRAKNPGKHTLYLPSVRLHSDDVEEILRIMSGKGRNAVITDGTVKYTSIQEIAEKRRGRLKELHIFSRLPDGSGTYISLDIKKSMHSGGVTLSSSPDLEMEFFHVWDLLLKKNSPLLSLSIPTNISFYTLTWITAALVTIIPYQVILIAWILFISAKFFSGSAYLTRINLRSSRWK